MCFHNLYLRQKKKPPADATGLLAWLNDFVLMEEAGIDMNSVILDSCRGRGIAPSPPPASGGGWKSAF
jgi:hypothetical protein